MLNDLSEPDQRVRAGKIGPIRREIIFEPVPEVPPPPEPPPASPEQPEKQPAPVPT